MSSPLVSVLATWVAGLVSWALAATYDYRERDRRAVALRAQIESESKYDVFKKAEYGEDINQAVANRLGGTPSFPDSLLETYCQPLFVSTVSGGAVLVFGASGPGTTTAAIIWVLAIAATFVLSWINIRGTEAGYWLRRWRVVAPAWTVTLIVYGACAYLASSPSAVPTGG